MIESGLSAESLDTALAIVNELSRRSEVDRLEKFLETLNSKMVLAVALRGSDTVSSESWVKHCARTLFSSDEFLSTLRASLPRGDKDEHYGFDHIPYLLDSLGRRQDRFRRSADRFLAITFVLGVLFTVVVLLFGYALIDQSTIGDQGRLSRLEKAAVRLETAQFVSVEQVLRSALSELSDTIPRHVVYTVERRIEDIPIEDGRDYESLATTIESIAGEFQKQLPSDQQSHNNDVAKSLRTIATKLRAAARNESERIPAIRQILSSIERMAENGATVIEKNQVGEILKRMAIGFLVVSFLLALLRYSAKLYGSHLSEAVAADNRAFAVRQFYVAFKCSEGNTEQRKAVLQDFMKIAGSSPETGTGQREESQSDDAQKIMKEIMEILAKKM